MTRETRPPGDGATVATVLLLLFITTAVLTWPIFLVTKKHPAPREPEPPPHCGSIICQQRAWTP